MDDPADLLHRLVLEDTPPVDTLTDCFRSLRNNCAVNSEVQSSLAELSVLNDANLAINKSLDKRGDDWTLCLRISAQFLGNLIVNNPKTQRIVWTKCCSQLKQMATHGDEKLTNICMMVLYNILLGCPNLTKDFISDEEFVRIVCTSGGDGLEFAQYIMEHLMTQDVDWAKVYTSQVPVQGR
ncbi:ataxin-10-like [Macrosteles quadrilineatus]|uniref:ataxin-10-like n=1 Tax=Macrosteles quadrilineatus TaxID=74068 RepID=UPI0023E22246|nr:ataxin-10-like [Macrosteles quadrilineatus]